MPSKAARSVSLLRAVAALGLVTLILASCGREPTGAGGGRLASVVLEPLFQTTAGVDPGDRVTNIRIQVYVVNPAAAAGTAGRRQLLTSLDFDPNNSDRVSQTDGSLTIKIEFKLVSESSVYEIEGGAYDKAGVLLYAVPAVQFSDKQLSSPSGFTVTSTANYVGPGANAIRIDITPASITIPRPGEQATFTATAIGPNGAPIAGAPLRWSTANGAIAFFPNNRVGVVQGVGKGTTQVVVAIEDTKISATASVTVDLVPNGMSVVQGGGQTAIAGEQLAQPVRVRVVSGTIPVPGATVTFAAGSGGTASPSSATTNASGEAETRWTLGTAPGTQTLTASSPGLAAVTASATATPRPLTIAFTQLSPTMTAGTSQPATVQVTQGGLPLPGAIITFGVTTTGASFSPPSATSNANGLASTTLVATNPGTYTVIAAVQNVTVQTTVVVSVNQTVTQLVKVAGDAQSTARGTTFATPFTVEARNSLGQPVPGVALDFTIAGAAANRIITDANGRAALTVPVSPTSGIGGGSIVVTLVSNPSVTTTFSFTVTP